MNMRHLVLIVAGIFSALPALGFAALMVELLHEPAYDRSEPFYDRYFEDFDRLRMRLDWHGTIVEDAIDLLQLN